MKDNNYLRLKIYFFIFIIGYLFGWLAMDSEIIMIDGNRDVRKKVFNYAAFSLVVAIGYTVTLIYDIYILPRNKNDDQ